MASLGGTYGCEPGSPMRYLDRTNILLGLAILAGLLLASCTAQEFAAGAIGLSLGAQAILDAVAPVLPPEKFAELRNGVEAINGDIGATKSVLDAVVGAFASFRDHVQDMAQVQANAVQALQVKTEGMATHGEVIGYSTATGAAGTAVSRVLSVMKHGAAGKMPAAEPAKAGA